MEGAIGHHCIQIDHADTLASFLVQENVIELGIVVNRTGGKIHITDQPGKVFIFLSEGN